MKLRVPWKLRVAWLRLGQWLRTVASHVLRRGAGRTGVSVFCRYQQATGATIAIADVANHLASRYRVDAYITPDGAFARLLSVRVRQTYRPERLDGRIVVVDIQQDRATMDRLAATDRRILLTCHALPTQLHGVPQEQLEYNFATATHVHFVSDFQRSEFVEHFPALDLPARSVVIPNYCRRSRKTGYTGNVGIVGYLTRPKKNAIEAIRLAQRSDARLIQCWGTDTVAGLDDPGRYPKVRIRGWSDDLERIHSSFDVLVSASRFETFGLVVAEAISAGIPCVLSDIPVFRALFSECPGVALLSGDTDQDVRAINRMLRDASALKEEIQRFWEERFSDAIVDAAWNRFLDRIADDAPALPGAVRPG